MPDRVALFIDAQNVYMGARRSFHTVPLHHTDGQVDPTAVGQLLCNRPPGGHTRELSEVRIYTGRPDSSRDPRTYGAHMRQCEAWERMGAVVVPRTLRYPPDWPQRPAEEKGVDVELAIDFIAGALDGDFDVGIIFSTDTDLRPALEFVVARFERYPRAESAAWRGPDSNRALRVRHPGRNWVHYLNYDDYLSVRDRTDYRA